MSNATPSPEPPDQSRTGPDPSSTEALPQPPALPPAGPDAPPRFRYRPFPLHPNFWWGILWCVAMLLVTQVPAGVLAVVILVVLALRNPQAIKGDLSSPAEQLALAVAVIVAHALIILFALIALRVVAGSDWKRQVAVRLPAWPHVLLTVAVLPAFTVLGTGVYYLLKECGVPSLADMQDLGKLFEGWPMGLAVFTIAVLPALSEELWCRAFLGRGIVGSHGVVAGVLGTSFLFGLIHVDPRQGAAAVFMGVVLHLVYLASRSLLVPMLLHFLNNAMAVTAGRIPAVAELDSDPRGAWPLLAAAVLLLAACLYVFWETRARVVGLWRPDYPGVECPPAESDARVVTPAPSLISWLLVPAGLALFAGAFALALRAG